MNNLDCFDACDRLCGSAPAAVSSTGTAAPESGVQKPGPPPNSVRCPVRGDCAFELLSCASAGMLSAPASASAIHVFFIAKSSETRVANAFSGRGLKDLGEAPLSELETSNARLSSDALVKGETAQLGLAIYSFITKVGGR